ncbi:MAG: glucose-6-phosphate dehydrogenase, partial [Myxococcota bacterium]
MNKSAEGWRRIVIEKPFGYDLKTAHALNDKVHDVFQEDQVYRIDHYLGKETVQNIMAFRFANVIFEPIWNRNHIEHIQVTAAESITIDGRGEFYDKTGVVRDVVQNHLLQIMALCTMEPPASLGADDIRDEKVQAIRSLHPIELSDVVMGQYEGYRDVEGVEEGSRTPTFVAMKLGIDNWRWSGVPIYVRAGKGMSSRDTHVAVTFRSVPGILFGQNAKLDNNQLVLQIQPNEGISLTFSSKVPGDDVTIGTVSMDMAYAKAFERRPGDAYERLLLDAMRGDATLFARRDEVERAWAFIDQLNTAWEALDTPIPTYTTGEDGPQEAQELMERDGRTWRTLR